MIKNSKNNEKKQNNKLTKRLIDLLIILGIIFCIYLIFQQKINHYFIAPIVLDKQIENIEKNKNFDIQKNKKNIKSLKVDYKKNKKGQTIATTNDPNVTYDSSNVTAIDTIPVNTSIDSNYIVGELYYPNVGMDIFVLEGLSNNNLYVGSGTMKPNQKMGKGNYAIAGHHMFNENLLFTPLMKSKIGDTVFLSDQSTIYQYKITTVSTIPISYGHVISDNEGDKLITLITCSDVYGTARLMVRGELEKTFNIKDANNTLKNIFTN